MAASGDSTDDELGHLQTEFDLQIANLILADDETRQDVAIADYETRARRHGVAPYRRLRRARRRFVGNLQKLDDGDDPAPAVEQFIPAILPVLKLGLKIIGRKRVVEAIGKLVGNLLRPFTGPKMAVPLANAIVDTGLRIIGFEMTEDNKATMAAEATAAVVEDTVRQVAQMPAGRSRQRNLPRGPGRGGVRRGARAATFRRCRAGPTLIRSELPGGWPQPGPRVQALRTDDTHPGHHLAAHGQRAEDVRRQHADGARPQSAGAGGQAGDGVDLRGGSRHLVEQDLAR